MAIHDTATVVGVTEACKYNDHSMCHNPQCACDCHTKAREAKDANTRIVSEGVAEKGPEKVCPKCGSKRPVTEAFCRVDGSRLCSLSCVVCGAGREPEDKYCWRCGADTSRAPDNSNIATVTVPVVEEQPEVDYGAQFAAKVKAELEAQGGSNGQSSSGPQEVVETLGAQGTFKLVSAPNPNKVRTPSSQPKGGAANIGGGKPQGNQQPVRPKLRLPIKPG